MQMMENPATLKPGQERYEKFFSSILKKEKVQYDYRTITGQLLSYITSTVEEAQERKNKWLADHGILG